jgi:hypothetical protein
MQKRKEHEYEPAATVQTKISIIIRERGEKLPFAGVDETTPDEPTDREIRNNHDIEQNNGTRSVPPPSDVVDDDSSCDAELGVTFADDRCCAVDAAAADDVDGCTCAALTIENGNKRRRCAMTNDRQPTTDFVRRIDALPPLDVAVDCIDCWPRRRFE